MRRTRPGHVLIGLPATLAAAFLAACSVSATDAPQQAVGGSTLRSTSVLPPATNANSEAEHEADRKLCASLEMRGGRFYSDIRGSAASPLEFGVDIAVLSTIGAEGDSIDGSKEIARGSELTRTKMQSLVTEATRVGQQYIDATKTGSSTAGIHTGTLTESFDAAVYQCQALGFGPSWATA